MIIKSVPPAHPQNNSDVPFLIPYDSNKPTKLSDIIATRINPMTSSIFTMIFCCHHVLSKRYMVLYINQFVDKYLLVILIFMVVTIPIAFVEPSTGQFRDPPLIPLFYAAIAGIIIILVYSSYKDRKERQKANTKRRSRK